MLSRRRKFLPLRLSLLSLIIVFAHTLAVSAQQGWTPTEILFEPQEGWVDQAPSLVADDAGNVHLAWFHGPEARTEAAVFYYSRWDGERWTVPVDILLVNAGYPILVPASKGKLHIFWNTGAYLYHSSAWYSEADLPQAWSEPQIVATCEEPCSVPLDVVQDEDGTFHIAFTRREGNVYYVNSEDDGVTWSTPSQISTVPSGVTTFLPRIAVANDGRIHVVWAEIQLPQEGYLRSSYAQSVDDGRTWSFPLTIGIGNHADSNLLTVGNNEVHLAWNGGIGVGGRYYQRSTDAGLTWSQPEQISSLAGRAGYPSIVMDSTGGIHILTGQAEYVSWDGNRWSDPQETPLFNEFAEHSRLALVNGNQLVAVTPDEFAGMFVSIRTLDVPALPTRPYPDLSPTPTENAYPVTENAQLATVPAATPIISQDIALSPEPRAPQLLVVLPAGAALLVIIIGITVRQSRS